MAHLDLILLVAAVNHTVSESGGKKKEIKKTLHLLTRWSAKTLAHAHVCCATLKTQVNNRCCARAALIGRHLVCATHRRPRLNSGR